MSRLNGLFDVQVVFILFLVLVIIALVLCHFIFLLIVFNKTLHSPPNLLICNTCIASILYFVTITIKIGLFYMGSVLSDWSCRILAYLAYSFHHAVSYSYLIQALSRLLFIFYHQHRHLLQYKFHLILIICQTVISFLATSSSLITRDVIFRPLRICLISSTKVIHALVFFITSYIAPLCIIIIIYTIIYCRVIRSSVVIRQSAHDTKRDMQLMRNILILFLVFLSAGVPSIIYAIIAFTSHSSSLALYMMPFLAGPFSVTMEKICLIFLNHEIRRAMKKLMEGLHLIRPSNRVTSLAFSSAHGNT